ncbi:hypothetical protein [Streptomyces chryseus]|uniref:hypothetical protein n=1 Tax=Streptomyces chryseus TaxID=68186 RepID=UPI00110FDD25|nr:hypothetical protein [Streptomyces chryseus]GGX14498.1 hypothetical protein GCM10010353_32310 [Streptomyces chryseus]
MTGTPIPAFAPRTPRWALDPYRFHGVDDLDRQSAAPAVDDADDYALLAPRAERRPSFTLAATDRRRLDLHAALTTTGVAPLPGDLEAIDALSRLDDTTVRSVLRWITSP